MKGLRIVRSRFANGPVRRIPKKIEGSAFSAVTTAGDFQSPAPIARGRWRCNDVWRSGSGRDKKLQIGPTGLAPRPMRAEQKTERAALFGGQLPAAKSVRVELFHFSPHDRHAGTAERLVPGPAFVAHRVGLHDAQAGKVNSPRGRGGWIKLSPTIHDHESPAATTRLSRGKQGQRLRSASRPRGQPLDERPSMNSSAGKCLVERGAARPHRVWVARPIRPFQAANLFPQ